MNKYTNIDNLGNAQYYQYMCGVIDDSEERYESFKEKLKVFSDVNNIEDAKKIAQEFLPINNEKNYLKIGNATCLIVARGDVFRVCLDSEKEYICYNIVKENNKK